MRRTYHTHGLWRGLEGLVVQQGRPLSLVGGNLGEESPTVLWS